MNKWKVESGKLKVERGEILILSIIIVGLVLLNSLVIVAGSMIFANNALYATEAAQAINLAEAGADKALATLNATGGEYVGENETFLGMGSFSVSVTTQGNKKIIESTGFVPSKSQSKAQRTIKISSAKGTGISFRYGIQVGEGGMALGSSNTVSGSIYSNGSITGVNNNEITGDVWIGTGTSPTPNQQTDCSGVNCQDYTFGKNVGGENRLDIAQSFKLASAGTLNKVSLKLKKTGNPPDIIVRVLGDKDGLPDKNTTFASGSLSASLVTSDYSFVDITFADIPTLDSNTTYWLMVDTSLDSANYWSWQNDLAQSYSPGKPVWTSNWQAGNALWTDILGDLSFATYTGGVPTMLDGGNGILVKGDVHVNTIKKATIQKDAYYQAIEDSTAANYFPGSPDPPPKAFPISEGNITQWKQQAEDAGVSTGEIETCMSTLGPGKIVGDVELNGCTVTIKAPVWITGTLELKNGNRLTLSSEYSDTSGVVIVDGVTDIGNNNILQGSGSSTSILMLLSTYDSTINGIPAIKISNTGNSSFLYAHRGIIEPGNSNAFKELTGWKINLFNSSTITYETGLASAIFSSGPSGSYSLIKGTYQVK